jgi:hypothetical protein
MTLERADVLGTLAANETVDESGLRLRRVRILGGYRTAVCTENHIRVIT